MAFRKMVCDRCNGQKFVIVEEPMTAMNVGTDRRRRVKCPKCGGAGVVLQRLRVVD